MAYNLLTDRLPECIAVGGREYPVHTDFRRWILVVELFAENLMDVRSAADCAVRIVFRGENPLDAVRGKPADEAVQVYRDTVRGITEFALCGKTAGFREEDRPGKTLSAEPVFDFTADAGRIYAAFLQVYGIDLCRTAGSLHFWKFMELLRNLPAETEFMRVVSLRRTDTAKIENDDLRRRIRRAKASVRIRREEGKEKNYG